MPLWGKTDSEDDKPKYLSEEDKENCVFIDIEEAQNPLNRVMGIKTAGWNLVRTKGTGQNIRYQVECLVAVGVTAEDAGDNDDIEGDEG